MIDIKPIPGPLWLPLWHKVLTMTEQAKTKAQGLFIPIALVGSVITLLGIGGKAVFWMGQIETRLAIEIEEREKLGITVGKLVESKNMVDRATFDREVSTAAQVLTTQKDVARQDRELRLLRDFVEGRVGPMPYRKAKHEEVEE